MIDRDDALDDDELDEGFLSDDEWDDEWDEEADEGLVSYVCEDCDYRWDEAADEENDFIVCPMCGSDNVTQL
jgi:DNA-directed RNA polymerase subunit RPC12/RpoP